MEVPEGPRQGCTVDDVPEEVRDQGDHVPVHRDDVDKDHDLVEEEEEEGVLGEYDLRAPVDQYRNGEEGVEPGVGEVEGDVPSLQEPLPPAGVQRPVPPDPGVEDVEDEVVQVEEGVVEAEQEERDVE